MPAHINYSSPTRRGYMENYSTTQNKAISGIPATPPKSPPHHPLLFEPCRAGSFDFFWNLCERKATVGTLV
ncbi:hypothetical protein, partial [Rhodococcus erythropolis]|uniref:hypothetical protein n=1 Tax=Rhodococcus erythropolis TaxID=1833 RepID=UPI0039C09D59